MTRPLLYASKLRQVTVLIPQNVWDELVEQAKAEHRSVASIIRERIEARSSLDPARKEPTT